MPAKIPLKQLEIGANVLTVDTDGDGDYATIAAAVAAASSGDTIYIGPGTYSETVTLSTGVNLYGPGATITGQVVLADDCSVKLLRVTRTASGTAVLKSSGTGTAWVDIDEIDLTGGPALGVVNTSATGVIVVNVRQIHVGTGVGVGDTTSGIGHLHIDIGDIYLTGNNSIAVGRDGTGSIVGRIDHILEDGTPTGTTGILHTASDGEIDLFVNDLAADTAWNIGNNATLKICVLKLSGTRTEGATSTVAALLPPEGFYPSAGGVALVHPTDARADFSTIQDAVDNTSARTIVVCPGSYDELVTISGTAACSAIIGLGTPWDGTGVPVEIDPTGAKLVSGAAAVLVQKSVELRNLKIRPAAQAVNSNPFSAVKVDSGRAYISNCYLHANPSFGGTASYYRGLWVNGSGQCEVWDSFIQASDRGSDPKAVYHDSQFSSRFFNCQTVQGFDIGDVEVDAATAEFYWFGGIVGGDFTVTSANEWWVSPDTHISGTRTTTGNPQIGGVTPNGSMWYDTSLNKLRGRENGSSVNLRTDDDAIHDNVSGEINAITSKATPVSNDLLLIEDSADSNAKKKVTVGSLPAPAASLDAAQFTDTTGNQSLTTTAATVNLNNTAVSNSNYSLSANEITINSDGTYLINHCVCYDITDTTGATRASLSTWVEEDSAGYAPIPGSYGRSYHREASGGSGPAGSCIVALSNGDKIRLRAQQLFATTSIDTTANQVSLNILKVA